MQKIIPCIWFNKNAQEVVSFYRSVFKNTSTGDTSFYTEAGNENHQMEAGTPMTIEFSIEGFKFLALNGGDTFKPNPSISFFYNTKSKEEMDKLWSKLIEGGKELMKLQEYSFSKYYGWLEDKFGVSWQLNIAEEGVTIDKIIPSLLYTKEQAGNAKLAAEYYTSIFANSKIGEIYNYGAVAAPNKTDDVMYMDFVLEGQPFTAMDSRDNHEFFFGEGISLIVYCDTQEEIDYYWDKLIVGGDPSAQVCGWLKDKFGVSWQVAPVELDKMLLDKDPSKVEKVTNAFMQMKKLDINKLREVYNS